MASAATGSESLQNLMEQLGLLDSKSEVSIRAETVLEVARPAGMAPIKSWVTPNAGYSVAFSPDGTRIALGDWGDRTFVMRTEDGSQDLYLPGNDRTAGLASVKFSRDDRWLASASTDGTVRLWDLSRKEQRLLCGHRGQANDVAFDPSGRFLASVGNDGSTIVWDLSSFTMTQTFRDHVGWAQAVEFSNDGKLLASVGADGNVFTYDVAQWRMVRQVRTGRTDLLGLAFSPDGKRFVTASLLGPLDVWETDTGKQLATLGNQHDKLWKVRISPDGRFIAAATWDKAVRIWDGHTLQPAGTIDGHDHWVRDLAFSSDSSLLLTTTETGVARLWKTQDIRPISYLVEDDSRETLTGQYSPDGTKFVTGGRDRQARLYDVAADGQLIYRCAVAHDDVVVAAVFSPDGKRVVSVGTSEKQSNNVIKIWNADDCDWVQDLDAGNALVSSLADSGTQIAWGTADGKIWLSETKPAGRKIKLSDLHSAAITSLDFNRDGRSLVSGSRDKKVIVWNLENGSQKPLIGHGDIVTAVRFVPPDGQLVVSAGQEFAGKESRILIWRPAADPPLVRSLSMRGGSATLDIDAKATVLAAGNTERFIAMWSLKTFEKIFQLNALVGVRGTFGFNPKRGDLAFDGAGGSVRVLPSLGQQGARSQQIAALVQGTDILFDPPAPRDPADQESGGRGRRGRLRSA
jgi:WD40 repeat protein